MKKLSKLLGILLIVALVMSMGVSAFAASITINRDSSYAGTGDGNVYSYYKVFSANYATTGDDAFDGTEFEGGHTNGVANTEQGDGVVAYTATSTVANKLGTWVPASAGDPNAEPPVAPVAAHWEKAEGNVWFDLTPIAGTTNYSVTWAGSETPTAAEMQAAAAWLIANEAYEAGPTALTFSDGSWTSGTIDPGYYLVEGATGKNLVAATTDLEIAEKNVYPPLDKTQADEDNTTQNNEDRDVAVGDVLTYNVTVTIPTTAAVGDKILVYDNNSIGLTYNNDVKVSSNEGSATVGTSDYTGDGAVSGAAWQRLITVTDGSQGKDVVFEFTMTVNSSAIVDSEKENESGLKYGPGTGEKPWPYESTPDKVEYKTYFGGIEKVDGKNTSTKLEGVKFTLMENGTAFNVTKPEGKDYYIPGGSSNEVVTAADGTIKIRGLDNDKTYVLTETENPNAGYNMLAEPVTLTLSEDTVSSTTYTPVAAGAEFDANTIYYIKDGENYVEATGLEAFADGVTYYTAETTGSSSYDGTTADTWQDVVNNKGTVLPSTGGIGTTIFYAVGGCMVLAALVLLITKKRMSREG